MTLTHVVDCLQCPHCRQPFTLTSGSLRCTSGHVFDVARQGHVNLLGHAPGRNADTAEMVARRVDVLRTGLFDTLTDALAEVAARVDPATIVDAGAGPGHHLAAVVERTGGRGIACDVSPYACRRAAKKPGVGAVVADTWAGLPVRTGAADVVMSVFAPRNWGDFARFASTAIVASPLPEHLAELRTRFGLLGIDDDKSSDIDARAADAGWHRKQVFEATDRRTVPADIAAAVVGMGPNAFHDHGRIDDADVQELQIAVRVAVFCR